MTYFKYIILALTLSLNGFAQRTELTRGEWLTIGQTLTDPKVGVLKLIRVTLDNNDFGTFLALNDSSKMSLHNSPMCGNDCFWHYEGKHSYDGAKLTLKFNNYSQHGFFARA